MKIDATLNPLPALTWNWLRMNKASYAEELGYKRSDAKVAISKLPKGAAFTQDGEKEILSLPQIPTALGQNFSSLLAENAAIPAVLEIPEGCKCSEPIIIRAELKDGTASLRSLVIKAGKGSEASVIIEWTSAKDAAGLHALQTKIYADKDSNISVATVQLLGKGFVHFNDIAANGAENSRVRVTQLELGAQKNFVGAFSTLNEFGARFNHDAAYFMDGGREIDMNFAALQSGKKTQSDMNVYGTLKDSAKKTYRGTIDFKKGCSGSIGDEQEETLLLSPDVVNKSIPLILCDEEDVQGEHGATIGRLDENVLFYMNARGINLQEAQKMMARAKIARVAAFLGTDEAAQKEAQKALDFFDGAFDEKL